MAEYWPLAITLFSTTFVLAIGIALFTRLRADKAESKNKHFGGVPHRSIYDLDTTLSARERLDERSNAAAFRRDRTQTVLREERERSGMGAAG